MPCTGYEPAGVSHFWLLPHSDQCRCNVMVNRHSAPNIHVPCTFQTTNLENTLFFFNTLSFTCSKTTSNTGFNSTYKLHILDSNYRVPTFKFHVPIPCSNSMFQFHVPIPFSLLPYPYCFRDRGFTTIAKLFANSLTY